MIYIFVFLICLAIGSFINVVRYRLPENISIIYPRSFCFECETKIKWFDNVPILSWLLLKGKCRFCQIPISFQYPLVEILYGFIGTYSFYKVYESKYDFLEVLYVVLLSSILLSISLIDIDHYWVPDSLCKCLIFLGIVSNLFSNNSFCTQNIFQAIFRLTISLFFYYLIKLILIFQENKLRIKLIGLGDIKLYSISIIWFGLNGFLSAFLISINLGMIIGVIGRISKQIKPLQKVPFAPFISIGMWLTLIFGSKFWLNLWLSFGSSISNNLLIK